VRLGLAYKAKGRPAIESMLIADTKCTARFIGTILFAVFRQCSVTQQNLTFGSLSGSPTQMRGALLRAKIFKNSSIRK